MGRGGGGVSCDDDDDQHHLLQRISEDVLIEILLWLPVISLLRFKSVCKSWRSIIESPFFIQLHATMEESSLIFVGKDDADRFKQGNIFKVSGVEFEVLEDLGRPALLDLGEQIACIKEWYDFSVVGCCKGIICLHDYLTRNVALWNPATKQSRVVPKPSNPLGNPNYFEVSNDQHCYFAEDFVRFGIDIKTNDYKLLLITSIKPIRGFTTNDPLIGSWRAHVYNLSTHDDSWRCLDAPLSAAHPDICIEGFEGQGLYLNGSSFFTATYFNEEGRMPLILSFDFTEEIFITIEPPFDLRVDYYACPYFIYFGENLALVDPKKEEEDFPDGCVEYDIWVLNDQQHGGVKESWTKFYTIASFYTVASSPSEPNCITRNGEFAIAIGWYTEKDHEKMIHKLELLNLITGEKKILGYDTITKVDVYKPSLVPTGGNGATHNSRLLELDGTP